MKNMKVIRAVIFLIISIVATSFSAMKFLEMYEEDIIIPGNGVTQIKNLSDYNSDIKGTDLDTKIYFLDSKLPGGTLFLLGGTHPNEPASYMSAIFLIENIKVKKGRVIIIPQANHSAFTHTDPQEASPQKFYIETEKGKRYFRYGSRYMNPIVQWPDPQVFIHYPSGQILSGQETRNLNRSYPGKPDGSATERLAYSIMEVIRKENANIGIDLHEASLEYPVVNAIVTHPLATDISAETMMYLQMEGLNFSYEMSPDNFHGLSHREWGDHIGIPAILLESAHNLMGRYHGAVHPQQNIIEGQDRINYLAGQANLLTVECPKTGLPMKLRVGRHITTIKTIADVWSDLHPDEPIVLENVPSFQEIQDKGIGEFYNYQKEKEKK